MTLNLIKLAVGVADLADLARIEKERKRERGRYGFFTRNMPKRVDELLDGGSIYWVIKGHVRVRQRLKRFHPKTDEEGRGYVIVEYDRTLVPVRPRRMRPFQGWRYLDGKTAPPDLPKGTPADDEFPAALADELRELGLL
ncbi:MAG TPA: DUF1489 domain-containing protein [Stellaceae bacterium]|jgi:hypothetical protein|nr:DUF1489 domain-containing protein [Stellaceae bacterium]